MPPSLYISYLTAPLQLNGTETTVSVNTLKTITGETVAFSGFSPFTKGYIIVDPESQIGAQPEIISFTGIDGTNLQFTGITRGLSAIANTSRVTGNMSYHGINSPVIISWGAQNINDLLSYVASLISGIAGNGSDTTFGLTTITENLSSRPRAMAALVSQQSSPNMTLKVNPIAISLSNVVVNYAGGNTGTVTAPTVNPRIDLVVYSTVSSALALRTGSEAVSPSEPTPSDGDIVLCSVFNRVGETKLYERDDSTGANGTNGYIKRWYKLSVYRSSYVPIEYAADSGSANAYVVTLSPVPVAYTAGMRVIFKATSANTTTSTLNVNSLGTKTILKNNTANLAANDIKAGQVVTVVYDGTSFQLSSPSAVTLSGVAGGATSQDISSTTGLTIAHGLGVVPRFVRITGDVAGSSSTMSQAHTILVGSTQSSVSWFKDNSTGSNVSNDFRFTATSGGNTNIGTVTSDATNVSVSWSKNGSPTGTANLIWEAWS